MTIPPAADRLLADSAWLRRLARRLVGDDLAPDLEQDVAVAALAQPDSKSYGRAWLATVARNLAFSLRRRQRAEQRRISRWPGSEPVASAAELVATAELQQRAVAAVLALPEAYRDTLLQRFLQGLSLHATAAAMGVPEETVRTRQRRALTMLREQLLPSRRRSQSRSVLVVIAAWSSAMNAKHVGAAAAVVLLSLLVGVLCWPDPGTAAPGQAYNSPIAVSGAFGQPKDEPIAIGTSSVEALAERTEVVDRDVPAVTTAIVRVHVRWQDTLRAASNVAVLCRARSETGSFARTDQLGVVTFTELDPGDYRIQTHDWRIKAVTIAAGDDRDVQITMARGTSAVGVVIDSEQRPVPNAVILVSAGGTQPQWLFPAGASDDAGRFSLTGLRNFALLGARHGTHGVTDFRMLQGDPPDGNAHQVMLRFTDQQTALRGQVTDEDGKPLARAWVKVGTYAGRMKPDEDGNLYQAPLAQLTTTDSLGNFAVHGLRPGDRRLFVYRRGLAPHREIVAMRSGQTHAVHVVLRAGATLHGTVTDESGEPVVAATIDSPSYDYPETGDVQTDANGQFRLADLSMGEGSFEVRAKGFLDVRQSLQLESGVDREWNIVLHPAAMIRGRLVDPQGSALANWWIGARSATQRARTDEHGRFTLAAEAATETLLVRANPGFTPVVAIFENVAAGATEHALVIGPEHAATARFRGRLVDGDGTPLAATEVSLSQERWPVIPTTGEIKTGADGTFLSDLLPPGRYVVAPIPGRWLFAPVTIELTRDEVYDCGSLPGAAPARLRVDLTGDESLVGRATVMLLAQGVAKVADGKGRVRSFERTFPRAYELVVRLGDRECHRVSITLEPGGDLTRAFDVR